MIRRMPAPPIDMGYKTFSAIYWVLVGRLLKSNSMSRGRSDDEACRRVGPIPKIGYRFPYERTAAHKHLTRVNLFSYLCKRLAIEIPQL